MIQRLISLVKKSPRRTFQIATNFISSIFSGVPVAIFFILVWKGPTFSDWNTSIIQWTIYLAFILLILLIFYKLGIKLAYDEKERQGFHDNFYVGIFSGVVISLILIFNDLIKKYYAVVITVVIIVVMLFLIFLYMILRSKRPK